MVRLFVGGLPPGITPDDLRQRFQPFGEVADCSIAPSKRYGPDAFPRNFGHVELRPKDEAALSKCISAYNGCKWKGCVLRCSLAHEHHSERQRRELADSDATAEGAEDGEALPPLGPGSVLRLKPPRNTAVVEVVLGSGTKLEHFPEAAIVPPQPSWEGLALPPASGYLFEQRLQAIAADLPPQLAAIVEARRRRGQALREELERRREEAAGVEVAYQYSDGSQGSASLQLGSDDDAATAAAAAASALSSRDRRRAAAEAQRKRPGQREQPSQRPTARQGLEEGRPPAALQRQQQRVVEFLGGGQGERRQLGGGMGPHAGTTAAADLSRFDSDSDADWAGPPAAVLRPARQPQQRPAPQAPAAAREPQAAEVAAAPLPAPAGSSGSSGGSELEEWLAGSAEVHSGGSGSEAAGESEGSDVASAAVSGSSGGSELEEFLAGGDAAGSPATLQQHHLTNDQEVGVGGGSSGGGGDCEASTDEQASPGFRAAAAAGPRQQLRQRLAVVDFVAADEQAAQGRQWWHKPAAATDLSRFASSSSDEEGGGLARVDRKRQTAAVLPRLGGKTVQQSIPQVDGAADSESDSGSSDGSERAGSSDVEEDSSSSSESSDAGVCAGSSTDDEDSSGEASPVVQQQGAGQDEQAGRAHGGNSSSDGESQEEAEEEVEAAAEAGTRAEVAAVREQQRRLAVLFSEGAAFKRSEPLPQIEAAWRVSRDSWVQDYRQKHRQAVRMLGRSGGGSSKRQRKN